MSLADAKVVFLSYASQDAEAARRICDSLRSGDLEVWFDQNELIGGDAWDEKIRRQIKECALFIPIISANTQAHPSIAQTRLSVAAIVHFRTDRARPRPEL